MPGRPHRSRRAPRPARPLGKPLAARRLPRDPSSRRRRKSSPAWASTGSRSGGVRSRTAHGGARMSSQESIELVIRGYRAFLRGRPRGDHRAARPGGRVVRIGGEGPPVADLDEVFDVLEERLGEGYQVEARPLRRLRGQGRRLVPRGARPARPERRAAAAEPPLLRDRPLLRGRDDPRRPRRPRRDHPAPERGARERPAWPKRPSNCAPVGGSRRRAPS